MPTVTLEGKRFAERQPGVVLPSQVERVHEPGEQSA